MSSFALLVAIGPILQRCRIPKYHDQDCTIIKDEKVLFIHCSFYYYDNWIFQICCPISRICYAVFSVFKADSIVSHLHYYPIVTILFTLLHF